ncbi:MAG: hypothetical protein US31_C0001G0054 [Berkelbacteria bacterium GW2011_GWA1_36_9]|uniref:Cell division protein FtsL n=1 Tax=Berkelbacteria bacterium GW2011_GWA1_36_9 TaxID=1618331 RepID=A0A0G0FM26_9BACT|nr:MAG: hypothetical protein US31_C0001G0054 [Berkelbacteria bacterium GW2011_GWA1_36_9]
MLIPRNNSWEQGFRKKTIKSEFKVGPVSLKFITVALLAIAALFYLAQSAQSSTFKYKIMELEDQKSKVQTDVNQLEVESARLKSLNEIKNSAQAMNLESAQ